MKSHNCSCKYTMSQNNQSDMFYKIIGKYQVGIELYLFASGIYSLNNVSMLERYQWNTVSLKRLLVFFSKPIQGGKFHWFRAIILNLKRLSHQ